MNDILQHPLLVQFGPWFFALVVLLWVRSLLNPDPRSLLSDHVMYLHGTLGTGKTAVAAHWVRRELAGPGLADRLLLRLSRRPGRPPRSVYASFELAGAKPLDLRSHSWPSERDSIIIIDEVLLLESNNLLPVEWFAKGCTLARQLGQQVLILSQASRVEGKFRKFQGTFGLWLKVSGVSIRPWGRLVILKRASEPFRRSSKGFKAHGQRTALIWIPRAAFESYNSRKIYGYTADVDGSWLDLGMSANAAGVDNQGRSVAAAGGGAGGAAAAPRAAQSGPAALGGRSKPSGPAWHRPGGGRGRRS